jgi:hypothetical protein
VVGNILGRRREKNTGLQWRRLQWEGAAHLVPCREPPLHIPTTTFVSLWLEDASMDFME